jgi:Skp family chaperone for outer membrane proteins
MTGSRLLAPLVVAVALVATVTAQDAPRAPAARICVVDLGVLFRDYERKEKLENEVNVERERIKAELEAHAEAIDKLRKDRTGFHRNQRAEEEWEDARDAIKDAQASLERLTERRQQQLKRRVERLTLQVLAELELAVEEHGRAARFDLIFKADRSDLAAPQAGGELQALFEERIFRAQTRDVLYRADALDETAAVLARLNSKEFLERMERGGAPAPRRSY